MDSSHDEVISRHAIMPGSFNPFTIGHLSILERALTIFDHITIVIGINSNKTTALDLEARVAQVTDAVSHLKSVDVITWEGLTVDIARQLGARHMVRGARTAADWEYEYNLATVNRTISGIETVIIPTLPEHAAISSSVVRELQHYGRDASQFLP
ncbi:MAG: pantetheine-phosphate adenylyltransferase [Muribaculaceae bacterium]|nr:pantetheine-phosphate adenylyltransferase [Muribaculaceae bacterium]